MNATLRFYTFAVCAGRFAKWPARTLSIAVCRRPFVDTSGEPFSGSVGRVDGFMNSGSSLDPEGKETQRDTYHLAQLSGRRAGVVSSPQPLAIGGRYPSRPFKLSRSIHRYRQLHTTTVRRTRGPHSLEARERPAGRGER